MIPTQRQPASAVQHTLDQALGREEAFAFVLAELQRVDTWPDVAALQEDVRTRLAEARAVIAVTVS